MTVSTKPMERADVVQLALVWAERGVPVFPVVCRKNGDRVEKVPLTEHGFRDATTDPARVTELFKRARVRDDESLAVGGVPGLAGYVVMDVDVKAYDGIGFAESLGMDRGWLVVTPSGGQHRWFRKLDTSVAISNKVPREWKGLIDCRADDGYVVMPGSVSIDGEYFETGDPWSDVPVMQQSIWDQLNESKSDGTTSGWTTSRLYFPAKHDLELDILDVLAHRRLVDEFGVDPRKTAIVYDQYRSRPYLHVTRPGKRFGISASVGYAGPGVLWNWSSSWDAFPADEAVRLVEDLGFMGDAEDEDMATSSQDPPSDTGSDGVTTSSPERPEWLVDLQRILDDGYEPVAPLVGKRDDGMFLFYRGKVNGLFGDPESGKTWVALYVGAEELNCGGTFAYVDLDHNGAGELVSRLEQLGCDVRLAITEQRLFILEPEDQAQLIAASEWLRDRTPGVAVVDSMGEVEALFKGDDVNDRFNRINRRVLAPIATADWCVITLDHLAKSSDGKWAIGASAKRRVISGSYYVVQVQKRFAPDNGGMARLTVNKDRPGGVRGLLDGKDAAASFEMDEHGVCSLRVVTDSVLENHRSRVSKWFGERGPTSQADATRKKDEGGLGMKKGPAIAAIKWLKANGNLIEEDGLLRSATPYRTFEDTLEEVADLTDDVSSAS
jgi:Bifunctional DNA primase/polymerase, N-terminal